MIKQDLIQKVKFNKNNYLLCNPGLEIFYSDKIDIFFINIFLMYVLLAHSVYEFYILSFQLALRILEMVFNIF